ncbi:hypothetical protein [Halobacillus salinus]|uniref:hypothetical protein n=1 Tax=Halobacillus salinus TaxID=192814 RepID=UPI0009A5E9B7|nr:hypothetical protein [Halobacillus salinus]
MELEQLIEQKKDMLTQERLEREYRQIEEVLKELEAEERHWKKRLQEEKEDVEGLQNKSLTNLFYTIVGQKDEKLEEEKQEVVAAKLKWREASQAVQETEEDLQQLKGRIDKFGSAAEEYEQLWLERKRYLIQNGDEKGKKLLELADKQSMLEAELDEINEALRAGEDASAALSDAEESLDSAGAWGGLDMLGGGLITTAVKHSKIDDANDAVHRSQRSLRKFAAELKDIGQHLSSTVQISGALTVADYFLDGLIVDWFVQNKIHNSQEEVRKSKRNTQEALRKLEELAVEFQEEKRKVADQVHHLVETGS